VLAKLLFENLFQTRLPFAPEDQHQLLGEFLAAWVSFERMTADLGQRKAGELTTLGGRVRPPLVAINEMVKVGIFSRDDAEEIDRLRRIRNEVVHGVADYKSVVNRDVIKRLEAVTRKYQAVADAAPVDV